MEDSTMDLQNMDLQGADDTPGVYKISMVRIVHDGLTKTANVRV